LAAESWRSVRRRSASPAAKRVTTRSREAVPVGREFPIVVKGALDMTSPWVCWLYQYAVGGALFFGALILALRSGALRLDQTRNRWLLAALLGGYLVLALVHAGWIAAVLP